MDLSSPAALASIAALPVSTALREALNAANVRTASAALSLSIEQFARVLGSSIEQATAYRREIVGAINYNSSARRPGASAGAMAAGGQSAMELLDKPPKPIVTYCRDLDRVLGGGVHLNKVTELCGVPGAGKTQLCMQLALNVQIPVALGGVGGSCVYLDTEGSMMVERLEQMAVALHRKLSSVVSKRKEYAEDEVLKAAMDANGGRCSPEGLLEGVHVFRCTSLAAQQAALHSMAGFLEEHKGEVKLIIVDSLAFHLRYDSGDGSGSGSGSGSGNSGKEAAAAAANRSRLISSISQILHSLAASFGVAILVVNQMTSKVGGAAAALGITGAGGALMDGLLPAPSSFSSSSSSSSSFSSSGIDLGAVAGASSGVATTGDVGEGVLGDGTLIATLPAPIRAAVLRGAVNIDLGGGGGGGRGGGDGDDDDDFYQAGGGGGGSSSSSSHHVPGSSAISGLSRLVPALGDVWAHSPHYRVILGYGFIVGNSRARSRAAQLVKSQALAQGIAAFAVTGDGIRDVQQQLPQAQTQTQTHAQAQAHAHAAGQQPQHQQHHQHQAASRPGAAAPLPLPAPKPSAAVPAAPAALAAKNEYDDYDDGLDWDAIDPADVIKRAAAEAKEAAAPAQMQMQGQARSMSSMTTTTMTMPVLTNGPPGPSLVGVGEKRKYPGPSGPGPTV